MKRYVSGILAIAFVLTVFAFKAADKKYTNYFFEYDSTPGNEATPGNWKRVLSSSGCASIGASCKIEISDTYVTVPSGSGEPFIDPMKLTAFGGVLPVQAGSPGHNIPNLSSGAYVNSFNQAP